MTKILGVFTETKRIDNKNKKSKENKKKKGRQGLKRKNEATLDGSNIINTKANQVYIYQNEQRKIFHRRHQ